MARPGSGKRQMQAEFNRRNRETSRFLNKAFDTILPKKSRKKYKIKVSKNTQNTSANKRNNYVNSEPVILISNGNVEDYQNVEFSEITKTISFHIKLNRFSNVLIILAFLIPIVFRGWIMWLCLLCALAIIVVIKIITRVCCNNLIQYENDEYTQSLQNQRVSNLKSLNKCNRLWQVTSFQNVTNQRINAGSSRSITRKIITVSEKTPFYLRTNVTVPNIKLLSERIFFLPDQILLVNGSHVGSMKYEDITITFSDCIFIESEGKPNDATLICMTWQYVNNNGTPDKRFKDNRQLPKLMYGSITITSMTGLNIQIYGSNYEIMKAFKLQ